jgi:hypothetical protein
MTSNHHVMEADALARSLEFRPELTAMVGSAFHKWEHLQPPAELLDRREILLRPRTRPDRICAAVLRYRHHCSEGLAPAQARYLRRQVGARRVPGPE